MKEIEVGDTIEMFESPNYWNSWEELLGKELQYPLSLEYPHKFEIIAIDTRSPAGRFAVKSLSIPDNRVYGFNVEETLWTEDQYGKRDYNYKFIESAFIQTIKKELDL